MLLLCLPLRHLPIRRKSYRQLLCAAHSRHWSRKMCHFDECIQNHSPFPPPSNVFREHIYVWCDVDAEVENFSCHGWHHTFCFSVGKRLSFRKTVFSRLSLDSCNETGEIKRITVVLHGAVGRDGELLCWLYAASHCALTNSALLHAIINSITDKSHKQSSINIFLVRLFR